MTDIQERQRKHAAYKLGVSDGMADTVQTHPPGVGTMHAEYERGVAEGIARTKLTVEERLAFIMDGYGCVDQAALEDVPRQVKLGNHFVTVTQDDDSDYYIATYETLDEALVGVADEISGERTWWPVAIFNLDTGESVPYGVTITVFRADDPSAIRAELTTTGVE